MYSHIIKNNLDMYMYVYMYTYKIFKGSVEIVMYM